MKTNVPIEQCIDVPMRQCADVTMRQFENAPAHKLNVRFAERN